MFRKLVILIPIMMLVLLVNVLGQEKAAAPQKTPTTVDRFDPARDAAQDIQNALAEAQQTNKRVILDVGGEWCGWCHALDKFFEQHQEIKKLRDENFVWVKINVSPENYNRKVLLQYPYISDYPHSFVLEQDGKLLCPQSWSAFQLDKGYDPEKIAAFLRKWALPKK